MRLVAIAKERLGSEEFTRHYWPAPAEIYFDSKKEGYPFFEATNGREQGMAIMIASKLFGGQVAKNWRKADSKIPSEDEWMPWVIGICDQHASGHLCANPQ